MLNFDSDIDTNADTCEHVSTKHQNAILCEDQVTVQKQKS